MTFNEWLYQPEKFGLRSERIYADLEKHQHDDTGHLFQALLSWLQSAYESGWEDGKYGENSTWHHS